MVYSKSFLEHRIRSFLVSIPNELWYTIGHDQYTPDLMSPILFVFLSSSRYSRHHRLVSNASERHWNENVTWCWSRQESGNCLIFRAQVLLVSFQTSPTCSGIRILRWHLYVDVDCTIQLMLVWIISISLGNSHALTYCITVAGLAIFLCVNRLMHSSISIPFLMVFSFGYDQGMMGGVNVSPDYVRTMKLGFATFVCPIFWSVHIVFIALYQLYGPFGRLCNNDHGTDSTGWYCQYLLSGHITWFFIRWRRWW